MIASLVKKYLANLAIRFGILNFSLKVAEMAARNFSFRVEVPFKEWTKEIFSILDRANDDGRLDNTEFEEIVTWINAVTPDNKWLNSSLSLAATLLRNAEFSILLPYGKWTADMVDELHIILEDGEINNIEVANLIKFVRENK